MARRPPDPLYVLRGDMDVVSCLTYGPDEIIYAGSQNGYVHVWDLKNNRKKCSFKAGDSTCLSIHIFDDKVITQIKGGLIRTWLTSGQINLKQCELIIPSLGFCKLELYRNVDCAYIFAPSEHSIVKVVSTDALEISKTPGVSNTLCNQSLKLGEVMALKPFKVGKELFLVAGYESGHICLWDVAKCEYLSHIHIDATPMAIDFDPSKRFGICGTESEKVFVFTFKEDKTLYFVQTITITNPGVSCIKIRNDSKLFVLGCWDGHIRVFSLKSFRLLAVLTFHSETLLDLCFASEAITSWKSKHLLAVACKDKSISLWSIYEE